MNTVLQELKISVPSPEGLRRMHMHGIACVVREMAMEMADDVDEETVLLATAMVMMFDGHHDASAREAHGLAELVIRAREIMTSGHRCRKDAIRQAADEIVYALAPTGT